MVAVVVRRCVSSFRRFRRRVVAVVVVVEVVVEVPLSVVGSRLGFDWFP